MQPLPCSDILRAGEGYIITIASIEALSPYPSAPAYSASKWGLRGWTKAVYAGAPGPLHRRCWDIERSYVPHDCANRCDPSGL